MRKLVAIALIVALGAPGCASASRTQRAATPQAATTWNRDLMAEYVSQLAIGSKVRVDLVDGRRIRGTLMKAGPQGVVVQPHTRIPEPPLELRLDSIATVERDDRTNNVGKTVAIAAGVSVAAVLSVFAILAAMYD